MTPYVGGSTTNIQLIHYYEIQVCYLQSSSEVFKKRCSAKLSNCTFTVLDASDDEDFRVKNDDEAWNPKIKMSNLGPRQVPF